ncbi:hypothetical protein [Winogradskyella sp. UBA3174]|uniref:hypothetical protein n=1 Tax=Winogradskyella sp. UBA3174 TaxID=1947785 RepID=UPI0025F723C5|nr:hypothetical protein [Winogradskyella sp. UBA3174]|tara:strand:+ start:24738 stop:25394 length:657 start_codon:yes stop_codon:yes gene_type:complete
MKNYLAVVITILTGFLCQSQTKSSQSEHYVLSEFSQGSILMKDGTKQVGVLNFNALSKNFAIKKDDVILALSTAVVNKLDTVYVANRKFFRRDNTFYEFLLKSDIELYVEYTCDLSTATEGRNGYGSSSQTTSTVSVSSIQNEGNLYDLELPEIYKVSLTIEYWIKKDGQLTKVKTLNQLKKVYKNRKKEIKIYKKEHKVDFKVPFTVLMLVKYLEGL